MYSTYDIDSQLGRNEPIPLEHYMVMAPLAIVVWGTGGQPSMTRLGHTQPEIERRDI